jgi:hypothetical protein
MMRQLPYWLWTAAGVSAFLIFAAGALLYGNDWWLSGIVTVLILAWLAGVLAAIYAPPGRRATILGAVVCGFLYILLALGPWFGASVSPWLLTTRVLTTIETQWLRRQPQQQVAYQMMPAPYYTGLSGFGYSGGSSVITSTATMPGSGFLTTYPVVNSYVPVPGGPSTFVAIGHWLCGVLAAGVGALAAAWISRRKPHPASGGDNPFAAAAAQAAPHAEAAP